MNPSKYSWPDVNLDVGPALSAQRWPSAACCRGHYCHCWCGWMSVELSRGGLTHGWPNKYCALNMRVFFFVVLHIIIHWAMFTYKQEVHLHIHSITCEINFWLGLRCCHPMISLGWVDTLQVWCGYAICPWSRHVDASKYSTNIKFSNNNILATCFENALTESYKEKSDLQFNFHTHCKQSVKHFCDQDGKVMGVIFWEKFYMQ